MCFVRSLGMSSFTPFARSCVLSLCYVFSSLVVCFFISLFIYVCRTFALSF